MKEIKNYIKNGLWTLLVLVTCTQASFANVNARLLGTAAPPCLLGGYTMAPFAEARTAFTAVTTVAAPSCAANLTFSQTMSLRYIGNGWATWSHGYTGAVYYTNGSTAITMTLPANTKAFIFYTEPNPFATFTITVTVDVGPPTSFTANGASGAAGIALVANKGCSMTSIRVSSTTDFAVGEFSIYQKKFGPESITLGLAPGLCTANVPAPSILCTGFVPVVGSVAKTAGPTFNGNTQTSFGIFTVSAPVAPVANSVTTTTNPYDIQCGPAELVINHPAEPNGFFGATHNLVIQGITIGQINTVVAENNLRFAIPCYNVETVDADVDVTYNPGTCFGVPIDLRVEVPTSTLPGIINSRTGTTVLPVLMAGPNQCIVWSACDATTGIAALDSQFITILDLEPPTFMPPCPKGNIVNIHLGPGECEAPWDVPPFMAMDNCAGVRTAMRSVGCLPGPIVFCGWAFGVADGYMFDIQNVSGLPITLTAVESYYTQGCSGTPSNNALYDFFFKTTPNVSFKAGGIGAFVPNYPPCSGQSPKNLWTLGKAATAADNIQATGLFNRRLDTFVVSGGNDLNLAPGETRGVFVTAREGTSRSLTVPNAGGACHAGPSGDANLKMNTGASPRSGLIGNPAGANFGTPFGMCATFGFPGNLHYLIGTGEIPVIQTCGQPFGPGSFFPIGCTTLCYMITDNAGNTATCVFDVCVIEWENPTTALACNDEIQISLDENCLATIGSDMVLEGGPYGCYDEYIVEIRDWVTNQIIDRSPLPGPQVGFNDIGRELKLTVRDTATGNSCWGHATVEDKLAPVITCPRDTCVPCTSPTDPAFVGTPTIVENCPGGSVTYRDRVLRGGCPQGYDRVITRTWTATDAQGNKASCVQLVTVGIGVLFDIEVPLNFDNIEQPMLLCNEKIDTSKDVTPHILPFQYCVDGYLLDSVIWLATGGYFPSPDGDLAGVRVPRTLGWNCIDDPADDKFGHPSPFPVYYDEHPQWATIGVCWGPDEIVMWIGTGYPGGGCTNLGISCKDTKVNLARPGCDAGPVGCYKLLRQWTVIDWCTSEVGGHNQIIKVADSEGPRVLYPDTVIVNMEVWTCTGRWEVPPAWLIDNCSNEIHYTVEVEDGVVLGNETSGYVVVDMPRGVQSGWIVAEDCCGNITQKRIALDVQDNVPPVAVCESHTTVSINGNQSPGSNFAKIFAETFDDGSFDNCSPHVFFKVIRMEELLGTNNGSTRDNTASCGGVNGDDDAILQGNQVYFDDHVKFCCADVGNTVMVVFRVFDREPGVGPVAPRRMNQGGALFNRFSDCMVEVEVQDKSVPTVVAPPDIVVSCWFWFDVDLIDDPNDRTFGRVVTNLADREKVKTTDLVCAKYCLANILTGYPGYNPNAPPFNPPAPNKACDYYRSLFDTAHFDRKYELVWGFDGYVLSTCGNTPTITHQDLRECGQGRITRTVVARGPNNVVVRATQTIWFVDCDPFYISDEPCDDLDDIIWPDCSGIGTTIAGCGADTSPDNPLLGRPQVINGADDNCALISIEPFDEVFTIEPDACFKILRRWVVIDWCQYDPNIDPFIGRWEHLQLIKVFDTDKPIVTCIVGPCEPAVKNPADQICYGHISLTATATDNCTPEDWLFFEYKIDAFNDGKGIHSGYDWIVGTLTRRQYAAGEQVTKSHNPYADDPLNPFDASGTYPIGIHRICWFVEDGCGNVGICCTLFEIKDCKAPTPYCLTGIITVPMPSSGCIDIWAKDLDHGSFDNCTTPGNLKFYFDGDTSKTFITICCADFVAAGANDQLLVDVQMWVEDEEGNRDYCKTTVIVQDNQNICPNTGSVAQVVGELMTPKTEATEDALVSIDGPKLSVKEMTTTNNGKYTFLDLTLNNNYTIKPTRNDNPLNGVTTADIVKIQKHILATDLITSPYLMIAADVNDTRSITAADMSELRKLILGVIPKFTKTEIQSWTFVPSNYPITLSNWFDAPRFVVLKPTDTITYYENFVAIKMGDINGSARASNISGVKTRNNGSLNLEVDAANLLAGQVYKMDVKSSDFANISGYQFTLKFDQKTLSFENFEAGALKVNESNFGTNNANNGIITTSWNSGKGESFGKDEVLFSLVFKVMRNVKVSESIAITSDLTAAEAYDASLNIKDVKLGVRTDRGIVEGGVFELYQNTPNPFAKESVISFRLPEASAVKLTVYDVTGKVIRLYEKDGLKGLNEIKISKSDLNASGVMYYQLDAANHTATKRMVIIE